MNLLGQFRRVKGYNRNPALLPCQQKNKRHVKNCDEAKEKEARLRMFEPSVIMRPVIRRKNE